MSGCRGERVIRMNDMKTTWHLCLSAGEEILFRNIEDYNRGFNCFALALYKTDSTGLVEAFMSNHCHMLIQTTSPTHFMQHFRHPYSMYFNRKYHRAGKLGERLHFGMEVVGYNHMLAAASYTLRNPLHHGAVSIPYAYPHCSVNSIFMQEMGKKQESRLLHPRYYRRYLGKTAVFPNQYKMSESGVFLRESVLDIPQVENLFVTPRAFNFYMSRKSSEEWEAEQKKDRNEMPTINLRNMEDTDNERDIDRMLLFESGKNDYRRPSDIDVCSMIDNKLLLQYGKPSIYHLTIKEKQAIAEYLFKVLHIREYQIRRCLAM